MKKGFYINKYIIRDQIKSELFNLFAHSLKIKNVSPIESQFIIKHLFSDNKVVYDKPTETWYALAGSTEDNKYGKPTKLDLVSGDGKTKCKRKASYEPDELGTYLIEFSPFSENWEEYTHTIATELADIKIAVIQNAKAMKAPTVFAVPSKEIANNIATACEEKEDGSPVVIVDETLAPYMRGVETKVQYVGDKLLFMYDEIRSKYLTRIGFLTRVNNTMQRIQSAQVYAVVGEAHDSIHSYIDWWNDQMEQFGLDFSMELNGALDEVYTNQLMLQKTNPADESVNTITVSGND